MASNASFKESKSEASDMNGFVLLAIPGTLYRQLSDTAAKKQISVPELLSAAVAKEMQESESVPSLLTEEL